MVAFVTGATGLLGNNLVRELLKQGYEVKALVRSPEKGERLLGELDVTLIQGDMEDVAAFAHHLEGVDVLFHTAAYFREYYGPGDHEAIIDRINVQGSLELMKAAHARGVKSAVDTSSAGIIGLKPDGTSGDEHTPPHTLAANQLYFRSKVRSEQALSAFSKESGFPICFILPGWMHGPYDAAPTGAGQLLLDFIEGKLPAIPPGGTSTVDVRDVARIMASLGTKGSARERYIVGGRYLSIKDLCAAMEMVTGIKAPALSIPYSLALAFAWGSELVARLTGKDTLVTVESVRTMGAGLSVDSSKSIRELGATFRPIEESLRDSLNWYIAAGMVDESKVKRGLGEPSLA